MRFDALLTQQEQWQESLTSATANLLFDPSPHPRIPYFLAGAGIAVDASVAVNGGLGWNLPARLVIGTGPEAPRLPLFAESRAYYVDGGLGITVGVGARL